MRGSGHAEERVWALASTRTRRVSSMPLGGQRRDRSPPASASTWCPCWCTGAGHFGRNSPAPLRALPALSRRRRLGHPTPHGASGSDWRAVGWRTVPGRERV